MTRDEVQAVVDAMKEVAKGYADACSAAAERRDYHSVNSNADKAETMRRAARMLAASLEKSEAARFAKIDDFIRARLIDGPRSPHGVMRMISWSFEGDAAKEADACLARIGATYRDGLWGFYEVTP
jgi:hypothetical protein